MRYIFAFVCLFVDLLLQRWYTYEILYIVIATFCIFKKHFKLRALFYPGNEVGYNRSTSETLPLLVLAVLGCNKVQVCMCIQYRFKSVCTSVQYDPSQCGEKLDPWVTHGSPIKD